MKILLHLVFPRDSVGFRCYNGRKRSKRISEDPMAEGHSYGSKKPTEINQ